jgi:hypothetical protein
MTCCQSTRSSAAGGCVIYGQLKRHAPGRGDGPAIERLNQRQTGFPVQQLAERGTGAEVRVPVGSEPAVRNIHFDDSRGFRIEKDLDRDIGAGGSEDPDFRAVGGNLDGQRRWEKAKDRVFGHIQAHMARGARSEQEVGRKRL